MIKASYIGKLQTVNHMYGHTKWGTKYLKPEGKRFKADIHQLLRNKSLEPDTEIGYNLTISAKWYNGPKSKTRIKKRDANNLIKIILDACCEALEIDDSQIFEEHITKQQSEVEGFTIEFYYL